MQNVGEMNLNQVQTKDERNELLAKLKNEVTNAWFAAVAETNQERKAVLLEQYRAAKRSYEAQVMVSV